ncbi:hypothetical protein PtA15_5A286 [Puccinia triticina]|uniref:Ssl1-like domain-containing protein n=1 Tax=Puccinia triticina TaxID=208348 RepID=A0ABY7CHM7_9BASI|nr:uncharacterized protein PtA15_5A286 [Puccinia triticina]WAQ84713.1 hypothetical protein PtA15_5A286 [Puccinia triticina]
MSPQFLPRAVTVFRASTCHAGLSTGPRASPPRTLPYYAHVGRSEEDPDGDWIPGTAARADRKAKGAQTDRAKAAGPQKKHKKNATAYPSKDGEGYSWEDESGSLESAVNQLIANKRWRVIRDTTSIQREIIRHLCSIIDVSLAMTDRDLRRNRLDMSLDYAKEFVTEFFDRNPISQVCILITKDAIADRLSGLSGNPLDHHKALSNKAKLTPSGEPSLQNSLEMARASLAHLPSHGSREVLVILAHLLLVIQMISIKPLKT